MQTWLLRAPSWRAHTTPTAGCSSRRGLIDHADQVALPLRLLRERPALRDALQHRYRYLLVDELQDANAAQLDLVLMLAGPAANVMVVGDPDQGIYDFRGASSDNVARFEAAHPGIRRVVLRRNYRSRAPIVEASQRLIAHNGRNDRDDAIQRPVKRQSRRDVPVALRVYRSADEEADAIADSIASRVAAGAAPADFAVLVRSNVETQAILRSLRVRGVPADNGSRPDLLRLPAVRSLLAFLRVVADTANNLELYALATADPYRLTAEELGPQLNASRRRSRSLWETLTATLDDPAALDSGTRTRARLARRARARRCRAIGAPDHRRGAPRLPAPERNAGTTGAACPMTDRIWPACAASPDLSSSCAEGQACLPRTAWRSSCPIWRAFRTRRCSWRRTARRPTRWRC